VFPCGGLGKLNARIACALLLVSALMISLSGSFHMVRAGIDDHLYFSSGVCLFCPLNRTYNSRFLTLNLTFGAGMGLKHTLTYNIDGEYEGSIPLVATKPTELHVVNPTIGVVELPELSDGSHRLTISVVSVLYNYHGANPPGAPFKPTAPGSSDYEASWTHIVYFTVDSDEPYHPQLPHTVDLSPPIVSDISLENRVYLTSDVPLNFTVSEHTSRVTYSLDGRDNVTIAGNTTLTGLPAGTHNVTVYARDEAGNVGASETVHFSVEVPELFPATLLIAAAVVTVTIIGTGLLVYFKKRKR